MILRASEVATAFSFLTLGPLTEWTQFPPWLQLLPVIIQLSNFLSPGPGTCSHVLIRHLKLEAPSASQVQNGQYWTNHLTSKPTLLHPMLFLSPDGTAVSQYPRAESFLAPTFNYHRVLWPQCPAPALHSQSYCFGPSIPPALPTFVQSVSHLVIKYILIEHLLCQVLCYELERQGRKKPKFLTSWSLHSNEETDTKQINIKY